MAKSRQLLIMAFLLISLLGITIYLATKEKKDNIPLSISLELIEGEQIEIKPWTGVKDGYCYFYLPSFFDVNYASWITDEDYKVKIDQNELTSTEAIKADFDFTVEHKVTYGTSTIKVVFVKSANVASLFLNTSVGSMNAVLSDKDKKEVVRARIVSDAGEVEFDNCDFTIKGHGNSTWVRSKKPFELASKSSCSILGMQSDFKWILLANAFDYSNIQNKLVFEAAKKGGLSKTTPECEYVDLIIDGNYYGLYLISRTPKSFLAEETDENGALAFSLGQSARLSSMNNPVYISNAEYMADIFCTQKLSEEEKKKYAEIINKLNKSVLAGEQTDKVPDMIDLESWARKYLIDEIFENLDSNVYSAFYYSYPDSEKPDVFYSGIVWDYDLCMISNEATANPYCLYAANYYRGEDEPIAWYASLMKNKEFHEYVVRLYKDEFMNIIDSIVNEEIGTLSTEISQAVYCNNARWGVKTEFDTQTKLISEFLAARKTFLEKLWIEGEEYCVVTLNDPKIDSLYYRRIYIKPGTSVLDDAIGNRYFDINKNYYCKGSAFDITEAIYEDVFVTTNKNGQFGEDTEEKKEKQKIYLCLGSVALLIMLTGTIVATDSRLDGKKHGRK